MVTQLPFPKNTAVSDTHIKGFTLTKEVSFRKVCQAVRDAAFVTSDLPIIVSLEVHCSHEQQEIMVNIIKQIWGPYLAMLPVHAYDKPDELALPSPMELRKRILIKVKYTPPEKAAAKAKREHDHSLVQKPSGAPLPEPPSDSEDEEVEVPADQKKKKKPKMIEALSELGIYTRAYHYKSFSGPEASIPTHVFSLSEGTLFSLSAANPGPLFHHNASFLMRCYPKGTRIRSSNLTPTPFWRSGVQMVALNWQKMDKANMLNEGMFSDSGGWVLKPESHRPTTTGKKHGWFHFGGATAQHAVAKGETSPAPTTPPAALDPLEPSSSARADSKDNRSPPQHQITTKTITVKIRLLAAQNLPLPESTTNAASFRPYFRLSLHTEGLTPASEFLDLQSRSLPQPPLQHTSSARSGSLHPSTAEAPASPPLSIVRTPSLRRSSSARGAGPRRRSSSSVQKSGQHPRANLKARTRTWHPPHHLTHRAEDARNPALGDERVSFADIEIDDPALCFLRVKLMDDVEMRRDELAGWACVRLDRLGRGLRLLALRDAGGKATEGRVLWEVQWAIREVDGDGGLVGAEPDVEAVGGGDDHDEKDGKGT